MRSMQTNMTNNLVKFICLSIRTARLCGIHRGWLYFKILKYTYCGIYWTITLQTIKTCMKVLVKLPNIVQYI